MTELTDDLRYAAEHNGVGDATMAPPPRGSMKWTAILCGRAAEELDHLSTLDTLSSATEKIQRDTIDALRKALAQRGERIRRDQDIIGQRGLKLGLMAQWADEILKLHRPAKAGPGCVVCFPQDGSWPCTAADAAKAILEIHDPAYFDNSAEDLTD